MLHQAMSSFALQVQASRMATIYFPVLPRRRGVINVTISATSFMGRDTVTRNLTVDMDGVTSYNNTPYLIDLINQVNAARAQAFYAEGRQFEIWSESN